MTIQTTIDATEFQTQRRENHYTLSFTDANGNHVVARVPTAVFEAKTARFVSDALNTALENAGAEYDTAFHLIKSLASSLLNQRLDNFGDAGTSTATTATTTVNG